MISMLAYGYSDQSTFSRAIKSEYGQTPAELRRSKPNIPDNRKIVEGYLYKNTRLDAVLNKMISDSYMSNEDWNYFDDFIHATDEYGFDVSTCCIISELSERLNIPFSYLINKCVDIMIDYQSESDNIPPRIEYAIDLGIKSDEELEALCEYYNCKYYELKERQVLEYRENNQNDRR